MLTYGREDLVEVLRAIDHRLSETGEILLIGGAVISLAYDSRYQTRDIDYIDAGGAVRAAIGDVAATYDDPRLLSQVGYYAVPDGMDQRLKQLRVRGLKYLRIVVPEKHDLAVMKIARGYERDIEAVTQIHVRSPLKSSTLIRRFAHKWTPADNAGAELEMDMNFHTALAAVFDEKMADAGLAKMRALRAGKRSAKR